jgi:hypothetical protein
MQASSSPAAGKQILFTVSSGCAAQPLARTMAYRMVEQPLPHNDVGALVPRATPVYSTPRTSSCLAGLNSDAEGSLLDGHSVDGS